MGFGKLEPDDGLEFEIRYSFNKLGGVTEPFVADGKLGAQEPEIN